MFFRRIELSSRPVAPCSPCESRTPLARKLLFLVGIASAQVAFSQDAVWVHEDYAAQFLRSNDVDVLGPDLFGESTDLSTGATEFSVTDVSLPGNSELPVAFQRRYVVSVSAMSSNFQNAFDKFEIDIPHLHGVFASGNTLLRSELQGWTSSIAGHPELRCSGRAGPAEVLPPPNEPYGSWTADEFWHGNHLHIPGSGDEEMQVTAGLPNDASAPSSAGPYQWVTRNRWYFSCLPSTQNGVAGEGFLAHAPDGKKYYFDWVVRIGPVPQVKRPLTFIPIPDASDAVLADTIDRLSRYSYRILPTRIEDRFGNFVQYTYSGRDLQSISSNDGRLLTVGYVDGKVSTVTDGMRTWTYDYTNGLKVTHPDSSYWSVIGAGQFTKNGPSIPSCTTTPQYYSGQAHITVHHRSGAIGVFTIQPLIVGISNVPYHCDQDEYRNNFIRTPKVFDGLALTRKVISVPGRAIMAWNYTFGPRNDSFNTECTAGCPASRYVDVTGPENTFARYTFGNRWQDNLGKLLKVERGSSATNILQTESMSYAITPGSFPYPEPIGFPMATAGDNWANVLLRAQTSRTTTQQGATFTQVVNSFDALARPISVSKSSSLGGSRTEIITYKDNLTKYVLGQVATLTESSTGAVPSAATFDGETAQILTRSSYGILAESYSYNTDGTLKSVVDGKGNRILLSDWKRGLPKRVDYPATLDQPLGSHESVEVDDNGWIKKRTDQNGFITGYQYDTMGRINQVNYPQDDSIPWAVTRIDFAPIDCADTDCPFGLPNGHWAQTITTGNSRTTTHYDALWRPLVIVSEDSDDASTRSILVKRYDNIGREIFTSYPVAALNSFEDTLLGTYTVYDEIDRVIRTEADSEHGRLITKIDYLPDFKIRVTNPGGHPTVEDPDGYFTTTSFQAYDVPSYDLPIRIEAPEGVTTIINRDVFGKPRSVTRSGPGG